MEWGWGDGDGDGVVWSLWCERASGHACKAGQGRAGQDKTLGEAKRRKLCTIYCLQHCYSRQTGTCYRKGGAQRKTIINEKEGSSSTHGEAIVSACLSISPSIDAGHMARHWRACPLPRDRSLARSWRGVRGPLHSRAAAALPLPCAMRDALSPPGQALAACRSVAS